ncbi:unnamed protein product [Tilletia caries]|uniref:Uncharacterized protein n=1 Tax=Tilletia caries TaxID=13290 RepID=A0ABN7IZT6_9BASI|nr:unnamed protein product [Tilletia caries]CAD6941391.1 unnamed protein product [Tilletia caries]
MVSLASSLTSYVHARGVFKAASSVLTCMPLGYSQPWGMGSVLQCQVHEQEGVPALRNANLKLRSSTISDAKLDSELEEMLTVEGAELAQGHKLRQLSSSSIRDGFPFYVVRILASEL